MNVFHFDRVGNQSPYILYQLLHSFAFSSLLKVAWYQLVVILTLGADLLDEMYNQVMPVHLILNLHGATIVKIVYYCIIYYSSHQNKQECCEDYFMSVQHSVNAEVMQHHQIADKLLKLSLRSSISEYTAAFPAFKSISVFILCVPKNNSLFPFLYHTLVNTFTEHIKQSGQKRNTENSICCLCPGLIFLDRVNRSRNPIQCFLQSHRASAQILPVTKGECVSHDTVLFPGGWAGKQNHAETAL